VEISNKDLQWLTENFLNFWLMLIEEKLGHFSPDESSVQPAATLCCQFHAVRSILSRKISYLISTYLPCVVFLASNGGKEHFHALCKAIIFFVFKWAEFYRNF
jgi:hypothetical protein